MKKCRHLKDWLFTETKAGPNTGSPPFIAVCEDCAAAICDGLNRAERSIEGQHVSGKSSRAQFWAQYKRVRSDIESPTDIAYETQLAANYEAQLHAKKFGTL